MDNTQYTVFTARVARSTHGVRTWELEFTQQSHIARLYTGPSQHRTTVPSIRVR